MYTLDLEVLVTIALGRETGGVVLVNKWLCSWAVGSWARGILKHGLKL
jgi:hypothetical protein